MTLDGSGTVTLSRKNGGMTILDAFLVALDGTLTHTHTATTLTLDLDHCTISGTFRRDEINDINVDLTKQPQ
jgi:hypothetical protein